MYNAMANMQLQRFDAAEKSARQGLVTDPSHRYPKLDQVLGIILVQKHEYPEAAQHMRTYLRARAGAADAALVQKQLAEVERRSPLPEPTAKDLRAEAKPDASVSTDTKRPSPAHVGGAAFGYLVRAKLEIPCSKVFWPTTLVMAVHKWSEN